MSSTVQHVDVRVIRPARYQAEAPATLLRDLPQTALILAILCAFWGSIVYLALTSF